MNEKAPDAYTSSAHPEAARQFQIPPQIIARIGDGSPPLWYAGELQPVGEPTVDAMPISAEVAARLSETPKTVVSPGGKPDKALRKLNAARK